MAIASAFVVDQQGRFQLRQPGTHNIMGAWAILFYIVVDQMTIGTRQVIPNNIQRPEDVRKYLQLQRKIKQVILQAILAEANRAILCILIDAPLSRVTKVRRV